MHGRNKRIVWILSLSLVLGSLNVGHVFAENEIPQVETVSPNVAPSEEGADQSLVEIAADELEVITFPDRNFERAVRNVISKSSGDITLKDVQGVRQLVLGDIKSMEGIQYFTNLITLNIVLLQVEDLTLLKGLQNLQVLGISHSQVKDFQAISSLKNLTKLELQQNKIGDISPLAELPKLLSLDIKENQVKDISALSKLTTLTSLFLGGNPITDFTPTAAYYNQLQYKDFSLEKSPVIVTFPDPYFEKEVRRSIYKPTGNIFLSDINGVSSLYIDEEKIKSIEGIQHFTDLKTLFLLKTKVKDISPLKGLHKLELLHMNDGVLKDISSIANLKNLFSLSLQNNKIDNISALAELLKLSSLNLSQNDVTDISLLSKFTLLTGLRLSGNPITDFTPTAAYYDRILPFAKDFPLVSKASIPVESITGLPEQELKLTIGAQPVQLTATVSPSNATFTTPFFSSSDEQVVQVSRDGLVKVVGAGSATITVSSVDKKVQTSVPVTVNGEKTKIEQPNQIVNVQQDEIVITASQQAQNTKLRFTVLKVGDSIATTSPRIQATVSTTAGELVFSIPRGTIVKGGSAWDGTLSLPAVKANDTVKVDGKTILNVVEVGAGTQEVFFDQPVRLVLPGQATKKVGFMKGGTLHPIEKELQIDSLEAATQAIAGNGEAKISVGNDLVIWTKHLTTFVNYEDKQVDTPTNPGSGGPIAFPPAMLSTTVAQKASQKVTKAEGGSIAFESLTVKVKADSITEDVELTLEKLTAADMPPITSNLSDLKEGYKLSSDKTAAWKKAVQATIKWPANLTDEQISKLALYQWLEQEGKWKLLGGRVVDRAAKTISSDLDQPGIIALFTEGIPDKEVPEEAKPEVQPVQLPTDIKGHWAESEIAQLVHKGIVKGQPDGTFKPNTKITRAEFTSFLVRALNLETAVAGKVFADTEKHWARDEIAAAQASGIVNGYSDEQFGVNDAITREQMAVMLVKAFQLKPAAAQTKFADAAKVSAWAQKEVQSTLSYGILKGTAGSLIQPQAEATRAEAAVMIVRALSIAK